MKTAQLYEAIQGIMTKMMWSSCERNVGGNSYSAGVVSVEMSSSKSADYKSLI